MGLHQFLPEIIGVFHGNAAFTMVTVYRIIILFCADEINMPGA
jgi:hypothetical protein